VYLKHFEAHISQQLAHPDLQSPVSYRRIIQLQIQRYKRALLGGPPYEPFLRRSWCWSLWSMTSRTTGGGISWRALLDLWW